MSLIFRMEMPDYIHRLSIFPKFYRRNCNFDMSTPCLILNINCQLLDVKKNIKKVNWLLAFLESNTNAGIQSKDREPINANS